MQYREKIWILIEKCFFFFFFETKTSDVDRIFCSPSKTLPFTFKACEHEGDINMQMQTSAVTFGRVGI